MTNDEYLSEVHKIYNDEQYWKEMHKLYSISEFAKIMDVAPAFLRNQIKRGKLLSYNGKISKKLFAEMKPDTVKEFDLVY